VRIGWNAPSVQINLDTLYPIVKFNPDMKVKPVDWLVNGLWQAGKINGFAGAEKAGKSRLLGWLLVGMASGSVLGMPTDDLPKTLYLCGEETVETVNSRIAKYAQLQNVPMKAFDIDFMEAAALRLDLKQQREWLSEKLLDDDYRLLIIDPFRRVHAADEDKSTQMAPILNDVRKWSNRYGLSMIIVHHTGGINDETDMNRMKNWFRGSSDIAAILDTGQYVDRLSKTSMQVLRAGRFPPMDPLKITDHGDERGFELRV